MSDARLDPTKVPSDLWARRIWVPLSGNKPSLVEVTDRNRVLIGAAIMILGFVVVAVGRAERIHWAYAVSALVLEGAGGLYLTGGKRGGFYGLTPAGGPGGDLRKNKPGPESKRGGRAR